MPVEPEGVPVKVGLERLASITESEATMLLAVALHVASTNQPFVPEQVSAPVQYAVHEFLLTQDEVSVLTAFVHDPDTGQTVEDTQV